jgi:L-methionine (R)-S-oxide reductase
MVSEEGSRSILAAVSGSELRGTDLRQFAMECLAKLDGYDWSGIYIFEDGKLRLGEYVGAHTDHTTIAVGVGVCGTAVQEDRNQIVQDVRELTNYLSCSATTRSEIVVLIRKGGTILGQIDIDGHKIGAFDGSDEQFLSQLGEIIADRWF